MVIMMANKNADGKKVSNEKSISTALKEMTGSEPKMYFILLRYAPQLLPDTNIKTFDDLSKKYVAFTKGMTEDFCNKWLYEEGVQNAVKWLLKRLDTSKTIELYNIYYEKSKEDVQFFKAFSEISNTFFKDNKESKLQSALQGMDFSDDKDDEES